MLNMSLAEISEKAAGELQGADAWVYGAAIDSRKVLKNNLFIALAGNHVDGHHFLENARESGAAGALVERFCDSALPQVKVASCMKALSDVALACRQRFDGTVFALTGSCGKTTTKEMLAAILRRCGKVSATTGNLNNEIGVPLTLFAVAEESRYLIVEMGAAQKGDIAYLMAMAIPNITVITNVRSAHLGRFGSEDAIAEAKAEIYTHLRPEDRAVINLDELHAGEWRNLLSSHTVITCSTCRADADLYASSVQLSADTVRFTLNYRTESVDVLLPVPGQHNVANALCAAGCAILAHISLADIAAGLGLFVPVSSRLQRMDGSWGGVLIDDTYNASPASVKAAIDVLVNHAGRKFLVLGDMAELGEASPSLHAEVGSYARKYGVNRLLACGNDSRAAVESFGCGGDHFTSKGELADFLGQELEEGDVVLVKGSRSSAMEVVVNMLKRKVVA